MDIGLQDVDFRGFPNLALMKISSLNPDRVSNAQNISNHDNENL